VPAEHLEDMHSTSFRHGFWLSCLFATLILLALSHAPNSAVAQARSQQAPNILKLIGKPLSELESAYGKTVLAEPNGKIGILSSSGEVEWEGPQHAFRAFKMKGIELATVNLHLSEDKMKTGADLDNEVPAIYRFQMKDKAAGWKTFFKTLGISSTGVKTKRLDSAATSLQGVKGLPKGYKAVFIDNVKYMVHTELIISKQD